MWGVFRDRPFDASRFTASFELVGRFCLTIFRLAIGCL